jgi:putative ATP-dependent endonuclease of OLD family
MRYLRRVTIERPELQLIVSTHSGEMMSACQPQDIVVLRQDSAGQRFARPVAGLPIDSEARSRVLRLTALHFDATRTASLFAGRLALVEGVTDALVLRQFGLAWAGSDSARRAFVDALTIAPMGCKVGEWPVQLLATRGYELATRIAILRDTDERSGTEPAQPSWMANYNDATARCFLNHPTLEPAVTVGNEAYVTDALNAVGLLVPEPVTAEAVDTLFREAGRSRKGEFAFALAAALSEGLSNGAAVAVPSHLAALFEYLYPGSQPLEGSPENASPTPD